MFDFELADFVRLRQSRPPSMWHDLVDILICMLFWRDDLISHGWKHFGLPTTAVMAAWGEAARERSVATQNRIDIMDALSMPVTYLIDSASPLWMSYYSTPPALRHRTDAIEPMLFAYGVSEAHERWLDYASLPAEDPGRPRHLSRVPWPAREVPTLEFEIEVEVEVEGDREAEDLDLDTHQHTVPTSL